MTRHIGLIVSALLLAAVGGCAAPAPSSPAAPTDAVSPSQETPVAAVTTADAPNFLLLISDEPNDIDDFESLTILVSGVGFVMADGDEVVEQTFEPVSVELVGLTGDLAVALWSGYVPEGEYTKVFLYVDEVVGVLVGAEEGDTIEIKLPSNKLHIDIPVVVDGGEAQTEFVFDISVFAAGNSGQYILKPQLSESGQGALYRIHVEAQERLLNGRPEWSARPEWAGQGDGDNPGPREDTGKPEWTPGNGQAEGEAQGQPESTGKPEGAGKPDGTGKPDGAGKPEESGKPSDEE